MKCISLQQPFAWAIFHGKDIENRTWKTNYRGPLLIHASTKYDREGYFWITQKFGNIFDPGFNKQPEFTFGAIIGKAYLVDCVKEHTSPWFFGPYGFVLKEADLFGIPIPYKGEVKIFEVPDEVIYG